MMGRENETVTMGVEELGGTVDNGDQKVFIACSNSFKNITTSCCSEFIIVEVVEEGEELDEELNEQLRELGV